MIGEPGRDTRTMQILRFEKMRHYLRKGLAPRFAVDGRMGFLTTGNAFSSMDKVVTAVELATALRSEFSKELKYEATNGHADRRPAESARGLIRTDGLRRSLPFLCLLVSIYLVAPRVAMATVIVCSSFYFLAVATVKALLVGVAQSAPTPQNRRTLADHELPVITILAPLFREAHALPGLVKSLTGLNYPQHLLDIKLLLEESDRETLREARRLQLDSRFDLVIVPPSHPQTKPKACNYGLASARGGLIVIYDAEDEPECDQLRLAAEIFAVSDDDIACLQARLNYYNPDENWLTRLFTLEYCLWFDHFLPALDRIGAPVPLGGTSNIFRTDVLIEAGGWDPYNVTEDADLGLRLAHLGYRTAVIQSTTYEEANCRIGNWMRQRSRWMKGFMQTWLVHRRNRRPHASNWRSIVSIDLFIGGTVFAALLNPLLWGALAAQWLGDHSPLEMFPGWVTAFNLAALIAGNLSFIALAAFAPLRRRMSYLSPAALLMPFYWIMMSVASWHGLIQLLARPSFWEKTDHGLSGAAKARRADALHSFGLEQDGGNRHVDGVSSGAERSRNSQAKAPTE